MARSFAEVRDRLFRQNEFAIKLGLDRIRHALHVEGTPDAAFDTLLIAGTNGKGSVAALCHAAFASCGVRTGLFTSPHLVDVRERIRVDGVPISEARFAALGDRALARWGEGANSEERLTYFELLTLMAAQHFRDEGVEVAVVEVGLGGRLDASNALARAVSVITPVSRDHEQYLGEGIPRIFAEKAAILRPENPGVVCLPVGWGPEDLAAALPDDAASPLDLEGRDFGTAGEGDRLWVGDTALATGWIPFAGEHQRRNASCALAALRRWQELTDARGAAALRSLPELLPHLARARWPGRWSDLGATRSGGGRLIVDCAHNAHAAEVAALALRSRLASDPASAPPTLVLGLSADKDADAIVAPLAPWVERCIATAADNPRALAPAAVAERTRAHGLATEIVKGVARALERAEAGEGDVLALGSIYLVGEILAARGLAPEDLHVLE